jgi:hypothetical protein
VVLFVTHPFSMSVFPTSTSPAGLAAVSSSALCPFHDGAATLDLLLAELDPRETQLFDAVLDLRSLAAAREDAGACVEQLFRVRRLLGGRHYLAFYRVRCWARRVLRTEVRAGRGQPWVAHDLPLDCARADEAINLALAAWATADCLPTWAHVRFAFVASR